MASISSAKAGERCGPAGFGLDPLAPAPRGVPFALRLEHLSRAVLVSAVAVCLALSFGLPCLVHLNLLNAWRLSQRRAEVQGTLMGCGQQTNFLIFSYRYYQYTFPLPDGSSITGTSYGSPTPAIEAAHVLDHGVPGNFRVPVEYDPQNPQASRIRGTSAANVAGQTLWPLIFLGAVFFIFCGQLGEALAKLRLLRRGVAAWATVTACRHYLSIDDQEGRLMRIDEFKERWRADHADDLETNVIRDVRCTFTFLTSDDRQIDADDIATLASKAGVPAPVLPALYDPARPDRARLLENLGPGLRVSSNGDWESDVRWSAISLRFLFTLAFVLAPLCVWVWWESRGPTL